MADAKSEPHPNAHKSGFVNFRTVLTELHSEVSQPLELPNAKGSREVLHQAIAMAEGLSGGVTKLAVYMQEPEPTVLQPLMAFLATDTSAMTCLLRSMLPSAVSAYKKQLSSVVAGVVQAMQHMNEACAEHVSSDDKNRKTVPAPIFGLVLERLGSLSKLESGNCGAVSRVLSERQGNVKDARRELCELTIADVSDDGKGHKVIGDDMEDFFDGMNNGVPAEHFPRVEGMKDLATAVFHLLKQCGAVVKLAQGSIGAETKREESIPDTDVISSTEWLDKMDKASANVSNAMDDLVAGLYEADIAACVVQNCHQLEEAVLNLLEHVCSLSDFPTVFSATSSAKGKTAADSTDAAKWITRICFMLSKGLAVAASDPQQFPPENARVRARRDRVISGLSTQTEKAA